MAAISDYLEDKLLDHVLRNTAYTPPTTVYVALFTADPTDAYVVANEVDTTVDDTAYARQSVAFDAISGGVTQNTASVTFPAVVYGSGAAPYTATHVGIMDGGTAGAGNLLFHGAIPGSGATRSVGETLTFSAGQLSATLT